MDYESKHGDNDQSEKNMKKDMPMIRTARRKEQSRSAAKSRRVTETEVYMELANALPGVGQQTIYQSDRIGLLRLTSMVYRTRRLMSKLYEAAAERSSSTSNNNSKVYEESLFEEESVIGCLDGFFVIVNGNGQLLYVSSGVSSILGFTQIDLCGKFFRDYVHNEDWNCLCQHLRVAALDKESTSSDTKHGESSSTTADITNCNVFFRMKTAMTPRGGRARKLTMAVYQPIQANIIDPSHRLKALSFDSKWTSIDDNVRVLFCTPFLLSPLQKPHSSSNSPSTIVTSRHEVDMRFRFCSDKLAMALEHGTGKQLIGQSFYQFVYPDDIAQLAKELTQAYKNSHVTTSYYRLATKSNSYVWVTTEAALLVQNIRGVTQKSVICNHYILSRPNSGELFAHLGRLKGDLPSTSASAKASTSRVPSEPEEGESQQVPSVIRPLLAVMDTRPTLPPTPPHPVKLLGIPGPSPRPLQFNSFLMTAMGSTLPFANPLTINHSQNPYQFTPASMFSFERTLASSIFNPVSEMRQLFINTTRLAFPNVAHALYSQSTCNGPLGPNQNATDGSSENGANVNPILDGQRRSDGTCEGGDTIKGDENPPKDETGRRHRLDAKTIESFEVAMIKNDLSLDV